MNNFSKWNGGNVVADSGRGANVKAALSNESIISRERYDSMSNISNNEIIEIEPLTIYNVNLINE
jgi:hypothetical protein